MSIYDNSWKFLEDFYDQDRDIVEMCNNALEIRSKVSLDGSCKESFFRDLFSTLNRQSKTYADFLDYVTPQSEIADPTTSYDADIDKLENTFLDFVWLNILSRSGASTLISKKASQYINNEAIPYLILLSMGVYKEWFIFGGECKYFLVEDAKYWDIMKKRLQRGYWSWNSFWHFYGKISNLRSKLIQTKTLSEEQLCPLVVLLIVLRREWEYSQSKKSKNYLKIKLDSLVKDEYTMQERLAILHALYSKYPDADADLKERLGKELMTGIAGTIHFHPVVAKNIIASQSYDYLYDCEEMAYRFSQNEAKKIISEYIASESEYKKLERKGSRLLKDYLFPHTEIGCQDVIVPDGSVESEIFVSLRMGRHAKEVYREPRAGEKFDYIQLYPHKNERGYAMVYNEFRKPGGEFWIVWSVEEQELNKRLKKEFSTFRHGIPTKTGVSIIDTLKIRLQKTVNITDLLSSLLEHARRFLKNSDKIIGQEYACVLATADKMKENIFPELGMNASIVMVAIHRQRVIVDGFLEGEELDNEKKGKLQKNVDVVQRYVNDMLHTSITKYQKDLDVIDWKFKNVVGYVNMAGVDNIDSKKLEPIVLRDFIEMLIKDNEKPNINFSIGNTLDRSWKVNYNSSVLMTMLSSIVDNAQKHGFVSDYKCGAPTIHFDVCLKDDGFLVLKVCNNGKPIDMRTEDYVTRGVFGRETGHTGIGGYQTNRFAEMLGGKVQVCSTKEWNTEIHLYIKYNNTDEPSKSC